MGLKYFRFWRLIVELSPQPSFMTYRGCGLCADDWIAEQIFWRFYWIIGFTPRCQWPECTELAIACYSSNGWLAEPRVVGEWLCPQHAGESGYCELCGLFSAGAETPFDWITNLCDTCRDSVARDDDWPEDEPEDHDYPFYDSEDVRLP